MDQETEDVNTEAGSSTASDVNPNADASSATATEQTNPNDKGPQSVGEAIQAVVDAAVATEGDEAEQKSDSTIEKDENKEAEEQVEAPGDDKGPVPYERFNEVLTKAKTLETEIESIRELAEAQRNTAKFFMDNGITAEEFKNMTKLLILSKTDKAAFAETLKAEIAKLAPEVGDVLPADLQKAVDDGVTTLEFAQRTAKAEAIANLNGERTKAVTTQTKATQQAELSKSVESSARAWIAAKQKSDPDFQPKKSKDDPDGKFEMFSAKLLATIPDRVIAKLGDELPILEECFNEVSKTVSRFTPKPGAVRRQMSSARSASPAAEAPKSVRGIIDQVIKKHGG